MPQWTYTESINQSLYAVLSRFLTESGIVTGLANPSVLIMIISAVLVIITAIASFKLSETNQRLSFLIFIPLSLIIYPGTLAHYSVFCYRCFIEILSEREYTDFQNFSFIVLFLFVSGFIVSFLATFGNFITDYSFFICQIPIVATDTVS